MRNSLLLGFCTVLLATAVHSAETNHSTVLTLTPDGRKLLVVNPDSDSVSVIELESAQRIKEIAVGEWPQTVQTDPEGTFGFITNRVDDNLTVLDLQSLEVKGCVPTGAEPFGVVAGDEYLFVSNQASNTVSVIHRATLRRLLDIEVPRAPKGLALSEDGARLYVSHFFSGRVSIIDTSLMQVINELDLGSQANLSQSILLDEEGGRGYLPQTFSNSANAQLIFDNTVFPAVSVIDLQSETNLRSRRIPVDIADRPVGIPVDVALTRGDKLYVVNAASNDVSVIDRLTRRGIAHLDVGLNPRGIVLSEEASRAYVNNTLDGTVSIIDTRSDEVVGEIRSTQIPLEASVLNGKRLFNDSSREELARDQWIACSTCHFDGEHDARTWIFSDGPRNTPSLLGVADTGPFHWSGDLDELQDVESTIRTLQAGTGLAAGADNCTPSCNLGPSNAGRSTDLDDLARYLQSLEFSSNPGLRDDGQLTTSQRAGKVLFESSLLGCTSCHSPPLYTNGKSYHVGTAKSPLESKGVKFDTPSLRGLHKTAPYLHDGAASSLRALLTDLNPEDEHGTTSHLSSSEIQSLVDYLNVLPVRLDEREAACSAPDLDREVVGDLVAAELQINALSFREGEWFDLNFSLAGQGLVDVYAALAFPDGSFLTFGEDKTLSQPNAIIPFARSVELAAGVAYSLADVVLPSDIQSGSYLAHVVVVQAGANPLQSDSWLTADSIEFAVQQAE